MIEKITLVEYNVAKDYPCSIEKSEYPIEIGIENMQNFGNGRGKNREEAILSIRQKLVEFLVNMQLKVNAIDSGNYDVKTIEELTREIDEYWKSLKAPKLEIANWPE